MLRLYTDLYRRICKYSAELTLQIYDDIILRGCTLPCGYIVSAKDLDLQYYPKDYRYYKTVSHYKSAVYEWTYLKYSLHIL